MQGDGAIGMFTWLGCALMPGRVLFPHCILYTLLLRILAGQTDVRSLRKVYHT
jgi:hypothetical protein